MNKPLTSAARLRGPLSAEAVAFFDQNGWTAVEGFY